MADVVTTPDQLCGAVTRALTNPTRLQTERSEAHDLFAYAGRATDRALEVVYELLDLQPLGVGSGSWVVGRGKSDSVA
jgi:hypothetical protein